MPIDWTPFVEVVNRQRRFLLTTHVRPDPDGLGSMLALAEVLQQMGKQVRMVISSVWPPRYDFLDPERRIERFQLPGDDFRQTDAVIILDTGTWNQLGDFGPFLKTLSVPRLVLDHHISQDDLGATPFVDVTAEATGRLVHDAIAALRQPLTERAAQMLFAALATDTGWFHYSNTTAPTFELAARLARQGARPTPLHESLYEQNGEARIKLKGRVLSRVQVTPDRKVSYGEIRGEDYAATGALPSDSEDLVNEIRVAGVEVWLLFMEQPARGIKVSFRSRAPIDVGRIAEQFGGGGHRLASGAADLPGTLDVVRSRVLKAVDAALTQGLAQVPLN